jgi:hypothetical protein
LKIPVAAVVDVVDTQQAVRYPDLGRGNGHVGQFDKGAFDTTIVPRVVVRGFGTGDCCQGPGYKDKKSVSHDRGLQIDWPGGENVASACGKGGPSIASWKKRTWLYRNRTGKTYFRILIFLISRLLAS